MKRWFKAAGIRALRTFGEAALAYIGTGAMVLGELNWLGVISAGALGAVTAVKAALLKLRTHGTVQDQRKSQFHPLSSSS